MEEKQIKLPRYLFLTGDFWDKFNSNTSDPTWGGLIAMFYLPILFPIGLFTLISEVPAMPFMFVYRAYLKRKHGL